MKKTLAILWVAAGSVLSLSSANAAEVLAYSQSNPIGVSLEWYHRATAYKYLRENDLSPKLIIPGGLSPFLGQTDIRVFLFKQIHTQVPETG